jgi:Leucine-rich repeat (LRR) protein
LTFNQLQTLPDEIGQLSKLRKLYLAGNRLVSLPPEIGHLSQLQRLYLEMNDLTSLPPLMANLTALQRLDLRDNPFSSVSEEVFEREPMTMIQDILRRQAQPKTPAPSPMVPTLIKVAV